MQARKWVAILVIALLGILGLLTVPVPAPAKAETLSEQALTSKLQTYFSTKSAKYTLALREIGGSHHEVDLDSSRRIEPASVIKLFWAWAALREVDQAHVHLAESLMPGFTWDTCLKMMIKVSDNQCASWVRERLGNAWLNRLLLNQGYPNTGIVLDSLTGRYKTKYTSAADTALLLEKLESGNLLSAESTTYFKNLLKEQVFRNRITAGTQTGTVTLNKGGEFWVSSGWTESDAAIVRGPVSTYVLVVFGRKNAKNAEIANASKLVFEHLQAPVTLPATFPRRQYLTTRLVWIRKSPGGIGIYRANSGAAVELYYADRDWVRVKENGKPAGWMKFTNLQLRSLYIWP